MTPVSGTAWNIVHEALARVFGSDAVTESRADTPLSAYGTIDSAWVMIAAAVEQVTGGRVALGDDDVAGVDTVGALVHAVQLAMGGSL